MLSFYIVAQLPMEHIIEALMVVTRLITFTLSILDESELSTGYPAAGYGKYQCLSHVNTI